MKWEENESNLWCEPGVLHDIPLTLETTLSVDIVTLCSLLPDIQVKDTLLWSQVEAQANLIRNIYAYSLFFPFHSMLSKKRPSSNWVRASARLTKLSLLKVGSLCFLHIVQNCVWSLVHRGLNRWCLNEWVDWAPTVSLALYLGRQVVFSPTYRWWNQGSRVLSNLYKILSSE